MNRIHLQGIGKVAAKPVKEFRIGEKMMWNYGGKNQIIDMIPSKSGKTIIVVFRYERLWGLEEVGRKMKADRLAAIG